MKTNGQFMQHIILLIPTLFLLFDSKLQFLIYLFKYYI